jgi:alpha/beta superfamily hydrolase
MERFFIPGRAGKLEAIVDAPERSPAIAALLCHPLPPGGGTMHTHAVFRAMRALRGGGAAVLRFNFRGVGQSEGRWDEGPGEMEDGLTALSDLRERFPRSALVSGGFSFGSWVGMNAGVTEGSQALLGLGVPFTSYDYGAVARSELPKALVHAEGDEFTPISVLERALADWAAPVRLWTVKGASHLFTEQLDAYETAVGEAGSWLMGQLGLD